MSKLVVKLNNFRRVEFTSWLGFYLKARLPKSKLIRSATRRLFSRKRRYIRRRIRFRRHKFTHQGLYRNLKSPKRIVKKKILRWKPGTPLLWTPRYNPYMFFWNKRKVFAKKLCRRTTIKLVYGIRKTYKVYQIYRKFYRIRNEALNLFFFLERRIDVVLVRANFATSMVEAQQLVKQKHILVNNIICIRIGTSVAKKSVVMIRRTFRSFIINLYIARLMCRIIKTRHAKFIEVNYRLLAITFIGATVADTLVYRKKINLKNHLFRLF